MKLKQVITIEERSYRLLPTLFNSISGAIKNELKELTDRNK